MERSRSFLLQHAQPHRLNMFTCVVILGGIIIGFMFGYVVFGEDYDGTTLKHISIVFRHGDKNPSFTYANDPYKEIDIFWREGLGQLTIKGKKQMFKLGEFLRSRYKKSIGSYSSQSVRVDSSDHDRCHQSAGTLLAALFKPENDEVWNSELLWQPIPIHAAPLKLDKLITVKAACPRYDVERKKVDEELAEKYGDVELFKYLSDNAGQNVSTLLDVETLFNTLEIERDSGKQLPDWTTSVFPEKMKDIAALVLASFTYTPVLKRLKGGPLIKEINSNMALVEKGSSRRKLSLYAAHDVTLVSVRRALGFDDLNFKPGLGAALIFELHIVDKEPQVEVFYLENYASESPERWELPGCPSPCSLSSFTNAMAAVTPGDWDSECKIK